jgi:DNA polymerase-3 subunit gamma/tau
MLASVLEHGHPLKPDPPNLELGFPEGSFMQAQLLDQETCRELEELASGYFGQKVSLKVVTVDATQQGEKPSLAATRKAHETDRMRRLRDDAAEHPALKSVQEIFGGEIKSVTPIDKGFV